MRYDVNTQMRDALKATEKFLKPFSGTYRITDDDHAAIVAHLDQLAVAFRSLSGTESFLITPNTVPSARIDVSGAVGRTQVAAVTYLSSLESAHGKAGQDETLLAMSHLRALYRDTKASILSCAVQDLSTAAGFGVRALLAMADDVADAAADEAGYQKCVKREEAAEVAEAGMGQLMYESIARSLIGDLSSLMSGDFETGGETTSPSDDASAADATRPAEQPRYCPLCRGECQAIIKRK